MKLSYFLTTALAFMGAGSANGTTIDFELPNSVNGPTYIQDGFQLSFTRDNRLDGSTIDNNAVFLNWMRVGGYLDNANGSNATVTPRYSYMTTIISAIDKSPFIFTGISLAGGYNSTKGGFIDLTFNRADGTIENQVVALNNIKGLQNFDFNIANVTSVMLSPRTTSDNLIQFDFFRYESITNSSLPEPSTWAFMLIGFGVIGYSTRRTRLRSMRMQAV